MKPMKPNTEKVAINAINCVSEAYGIQETTFFKKHGTRRHVEARWVVWKLLRKYTSESFTAIGRLFGHDHCTVQYGLKTLDGYIDVDHKTRAEYEAIEEAFKANVN